MNEWCWVKCLLVPDPKQAALCELAGHANVCWDPRSNIQGGCRSSVCTAGTKEGLVMGVISGWGPGGWAHRGACLTTAPIRTQLGKGISDSSRTTCTPGSQHQCVLHTLRAAGEPGGRQESVFTPSTQARPPRSGRHALCESGPHIIMAELHLSSERSVL